MHWTSTISLVTAFLASDVLATAIPQPLDSAANATRLLRARQGGFDTQSEIGDNYLAVQDASGNPPQAFTILWDAITNDDSDLCTATGCNFDQQKCTLATADSEICIAAQGVYTREIRNDFVFGARHIFDRTVLRGSGSTDTPLGAIELGTDLVSLVADVGPYSGYYIRVQLTMGPTDGGKCPRAIETIADGLSNLPGVGAAFGFVGFFCNAAEQPNLILQATG